MIIVYQNMIGYVCLGFDFGSLDVSQAFYVFFGGDFQDQLKQTTHLNIVTT